MSKSELGDDARDWWHPRLARYVQLVVGVLEPVYRQIDPMHVGEAGRAMKVADDYARRLNKFGNNVRVEALQRLIAGYSSHGYVIDREEAKAYFRNVRPPTELEEKLTIELGDVALVPGSYLGEDAVVGYLSTEKSAKMRKEADDGSRAKGAARSRRKSSPRAATKAARGASSAGNGQLTEADLSRVAARPGPPS